MTTPSGDRPTLTRVQRRLIIAVAAGAAAIAAIGFIGSYAAVRKLAQAKGFGTFAHAFPIGIDAGILVLLALDLLLTWLHIPFALLRQTAWLLTMATIAFNAAAAWPDPIGTGMHATIPVLFVVVVEAARHAIGRTAAITAGRHMDPVRLVRWLLDPVSTFRLWRRMKLWELRSYDQVIQLEQSRLIERARLRSRYGRRWRSKAPVEAVLALRLTRYGRALAPVHGVLDIEPVPHGAPAHSPAARLAVAGPGSAPAVPALPPVSREPGSEPVSPASVSREPDAPAHDPSGELSREPGQRAEPAQSFGEHAAAAIEITLSPLAVDASAHPAPGEPSPEPDREPTPDPAHADGPAAGEPVLALLRAFAQDDREPVSAPADPPQQPAPAATPPATRDQAEADAAWLVIQAAARRTALGPAHTTEPAPPGEPQPLGPVSRPVSPEPSREPPGEPGPTETDEIDQQITALASRIRGGDRLTKSIAAGLLGVSEATAGRRLKAARTRVSEGTGFYP